MDLDALARAVSEGYMQWDLDRVRATQEGMLRLDALLRAVIL
jgi:hypothetical protein